jgi:hypothetical protein
MHTSILGWTSGEGRADVLIVLVGMIVLGLASFGAMLAFVKFCDRV